MTDHGTFSALITQATKLVADENIKQLEISRGKICWIKFSNIKNRQQQKMSLFMARMFCGQTHTFTAIQLLQGSPLTSHAHINSILKFLINASVIQYTYATGSRDFFLHQIQ